MAFFWSFARSIAAALSLFTLLLGCTPAAKSNATVERSDKQVMTEIPEEAKDPVRPSIIQDELNAIRRKLDEISLDLNCEQDQECIALGANDNACGIPTEWLIFSTRAPRYIEVQDLLARSFYLDNTYPNSRIQVCGGPSQPKLQCSGGQCQTLPFGP